MKTNKEIVTQDTGLATLIETLTNVTVQIPDEELNKEPFSFEWNITDSNREEMISYFERLIRGSFEYDFMIDLFKTALDVSACVFFAKYSLQNGMKLQFHHHPFTLYDYVEAVINRQMQERGENKVTEEEVCIEVVKLHYKFMVGLVPLDVTSHQLVHDHVLEIPPELIIGEYEKFYELYSDYIPEETKLKYIDYMTNYPKGYELVYPEKFTYKPSTVITSNKYILTEEKINKLLLGDKMKHINNKEISKLLEAS